jgi:hypothetical protein
MQLPKGTKSPGIPYQHIKNVIVDPCLSNLGVYNIAVTPKTIAAGGSAGGGGEGMNLDSTYSGNWTNSEEDS